MAALTYRPASAVGTVSGNQWQERVYKLGSAQTLRYGDLIVSSSGTAIIAATSAPFTGGGDNVLGFANHAAKTVSPWYLDQVSGDEQAPAGGTYGGTFMGSANLLGSEEGTGLHVALANADNIFEVNYSGTLALALIGATKQLFLETTFNLFWAIQDVTGTAAMTIVAIPNYPNQVIGTDTVGRVWAQFIAATSALF